MIARGFEFLDANWIEAGGLPEAVARRFGPFKSHCIETTSTALRAYAAAGKEMAYLLDRQRPDGRWIGGHFKSVVIHDNEKKEDLSVTALVIPLLSLSPTGGR